MKFDVFSWDEVKTNVETQSPKGVLRLLCSAPSPLYITAQGVESLAGYGSDHTVEVSEEVTFRVEAPKGVRCFKYRAFAETSVEAEGETFTNIDRMPHESGLLADVTRARRMLEIEKRQMLNDIRREASIARNSVKAKAPVAPPADTAPAPEASKEADAEGAEK